MKVLFITLSNIGDAVLTMPALSAILENFKDTQITLLVSPRAADLFKGDPCFENIIVYKKNASLGKKMALIKALRGMEFDLLVDFKDTMLPFLLYAKRKTPAFKKLPPYIMHMKDKHLWKLRQALPQISGPDYRPNIWIPEGVSTQVEGILKSNHVNIAGLMVAVAPGARSHTKQWARDGFLNVCKRLMEELRAQVILIGDQQDSQICSQIQAQMGSSALNLCCKTDLKQLSALLKRCNLLITNDSAPMHIAWAVGTPVVAIFGPTDPDRYRPTGPKDIVIRKDMQCSPCRLALCKFNNECMKAVSADEVFNAAKSIL